MSETGKACWYAAGLRFSCLPGCVRCCTGEPGDVDVTHEDIARIAAYLKIPVDEFEAASVRHYSSGRMSLTERANGDCVLLAKTGCSAYAVRPRQCRDYPFWPEVMRRPAAWKREAGRCPGLNSGALHDAAKIARILAGQQD
jgi:hypothetical protein